MFLPSSKQREYIFLGLGVLGSLLLSLRYLGRDLWFDEAFSVLAIVKPWPELLSFLGGDVHPPLYYMFLKAWGSIFGMSPEALRCMSLVAFFALAALLWSLFTRLAPKMRLPLLLLFLFSPFFLGYATEMRMYSLWALFIVAATDSLLRYKDSPSLNYLLGFGAYMGCAFLTHYFTIFFGALIGMVYMAMLILQHKRYPWWHLPLLAAFFFLPIAWWMPSALAQYAHLSAEGLSSWWVQGIGWEVLPKITGVLTFGHPFGNIGNLSPFAAWQSMAGVALFAILFCSLRWPKSPVEKLALIAFLLGLGGFLFFVGASLQHKNFFTERYFYPYALFLFFGLWIFLSRWRIIFWILWTALMASWIIHFTLYAPPMTQQETIATIQEQPLSREVIVTDSLRYVLLSAYPHRPFCYFNEAKPQENFWAYALVPTACVYNDAAKIPADALWLR